MAVLIVDQADLLKRLEEAGDRLVVIDFYASWCGPCKMIGPKLEELATTLGDVIMILKVDVDECEEIAMSYNISTMPTFVFIKNGDTLESFSGANYDKIKSTVSKYQ